MPLVVSEIFHSIQGESVHAGRPCLFVRLTGCNLRCGYCDTRYAYEGGETMTIPEILSRLSAFPRCGLAEITGGEPLLQDETPALVQALRAAGLTVLVETNGSLDISRIPPPCIRIVDMKTPSSGESGRNDYGNLARLQPPDQVKFVIGSREDYRFSREAAARIPSRIPSHHVLFSPMAGVLDPAELARWILADGLDYRLHLQLHKILWPREDRGV